MKAIEQYKIDDTNLFRIQYLGLIFINLLASFILAKFYGIKGLWLGQVIQDLFIIIAQYMFYLNESNE